MHGHLLIVGLGNPGKKYEGTRHNIGNFVVQWLAHKMGWTWKEDKRFQALVAKGQVEVSPEENVQLHLLLPMTYMNESGRALRLYMDYYRLTNEQVLVVTDDIALPFGTLRLRLKGSSGGHNGLKSIANHLKTEEYLRLRLGVGAPPGDWTRREDLLEDYVLSSFSRREQEKLDVFVESAVVALERLMREDVFRVMNDVNVKTPKKGQEKKDE